MKKVQRRIQSILLVLSVLTFPTVDVFAKEGMAMTISGPGIKGEITLGSSDQLWQLEDSEFFGFSDNLKFVEPIENPGDAYKIIAYIIENGNLIPFVEMVYYPAKEGAGYVHYIRKIAAGSLKPVDEWAKLPLKAEKAFRKLMDYNNIILQPVIFTRPALALEQQSQPEFQPAPSPAPPAATQAKYILLAVMAAIPAVVRAGLVLRKRLASQRRPG